MSYSNAIYYIDPENGADCADLTVVIASNPSGSITRMTKAGHSLRTGTFVTTSLFTTWLNGEWKITVVDADNFDLDGAVWQATADASGSIVTQMTAVTVANPSGSITRCTKTAHGLEDGGYVTLSAFTAWLNGAWQISVVDADNFDLVGAVWQTTGDASGTVNPHRGGSKADAWQTFQYGASAARIQPGDVIRVMASPEPTLVGDVGWVQYSKTLTLPAAVTATIADCETAWTGSANVTQTADTAAFKEGAKSAKSVIAAGFTTGKLAYFATGTLDLSAYQQISLWFKSSTTLVAGTVELRLCSDTIGDTAVHTIAIPALPSGSGWVPLTFDLAAPLSAAIASVSLYANIDPGAVTYNIDHIIACKASSAADALSLTSLIGKVHNLSWVASSTYTANAIRRPTQPNRNGFCYQVTAGGGGAAGATEPAWPQELGITVTDSALTWTCLDLEDTWYPIQSIVGTTVLLDNATSTLGNAGQGHDSATETVATYKRETSKTLMIASGTASQAMDSGTQDSPITYSGGWDRTSMAAQTGETWLDGQNGLGYGMGNYSGSADYTTTENFGVVRYSSGYAFYNAILTVLRNMHFVGCGSGLDVLSNGAPQLHIKGLVSCSCSSIGIYLFNLASGLIENCRSSNALSDGVRTGTSYDYSRLTLRNFVVRNNAAYALWDLSKASPSISNWMTANNDSGALATTAAETHLTNCLLGEATEFAALPAFYDWYIYSQKHDQIENNHLITTDGGTIVSATDQRHTASGISWKFRPTSTNRGVGYPLRLSVAKIAVSAGVAVTVNIWTRRSSTNIKGSLVIRGGQIAGVPVDISVACEPTIDTWAQSGNLTFTPSEAGVVEILFLCWDGAGTTNSLWVDDLTVA